MALNDPSFNVRYEAVLALSHLPFDNQVLEALKKVLYSEEADLSELAGWVLGMRGDKRAVEALRYMLKNGRYALLRARCARSLANLGDRESAKDILNGFRREEHISIKVAYASALGKLKVLDAFEEVERLLTALTDVSLQGEVALAIARMAGTEKHFVRLWRMLSVEDGGGGLTGYIVGMGKKYGENRVVEFIKDSLNKASDLFAIGNYMEGVRKLVEAGEKILMMAPVENELIKKVIERSVFLLKDTKELRKDYLILLITAIEHIAVYEVKMEKEEKA
jgi:hypothetical protein